MNATMEKEKLVFHIEMTPAEYRALNGTASILYQRAVESRNPDAAIKTVEPVVALLDSIVAARHECQCH